MRRFGMAVIYLRAIATTVASAYYAIATLPSEVGS